MYCRRMKTSALFRLLMKLLQLSHLWPATEVEGVSSMAGNITNELMSKVGVKGLTKGVKVEVFNHQVRAELAVLMEYGYNIPATSQKVQERVKNAIENMTGLTVTDVNIRIAGVNMSAGKH